MADTIIRAECTTNSADDNKGRVRLKSDGIWNQETELVPSLNGVALNKGDIVFVSVIDGYYNPVILGKADRNDVVLSLLVNRINQLEDKINELVDKQNDVITKLSAATSAADFIWEAAETTFLPMTADPLKKIAKKTTVKDIQDNYK